MHDDNYDIAVLGLVAIVLWKSSNCLIHLYSYFVELNQLSAVVGVHARSGLIKTMDSNYVDSGLIVLVTTAQSGHGPFCSLAVLLSFVFKLYLH